MAFVVAVRYFLGDASKCFFFGSAQLDEVNGFGDLASLDLHRHTIAKQGVNLLVVSDTRLAVRRMYMA